MPQGQPYHPMSPLNQMSQFMRNDPGTRLQLLQALQPSEMGEAEQALIPLLADRVARDQRLAAVQQGDGGGGGGFLSGLLQALGIVMGPSEALDMGAFQPAREALQRDRMERRRGN